MAQVGQSFNPYKLFVGSFLPNALLRFPGLSSSAKLVWARLGQYAGKDGRAFPRMATLAEEVALSEVQVQRLLKELVEHGFLCRQKATGEGRLRHLPDTYTFLFHSCFDARLCFSRDIVDDTSEDIGDDTSNIRESVLRESKERPPISPKGDDTPRPPNWGSPQDLVDLYNDETPDELPAVSKLSPGRISKAKFYLKAFPDREFWFGVCKQIHRSAFLRGLKPTTNGGTFRADFDWLLTKGKDGSENCVKVYEGRYTDERRQ